MKSDGSWSADRNIVTIASSTGPLNEIERNRALYSFADTGIAMLPPRSARCVGTARVLYAQILDQIERRGCDVFSGRARVPTWRKAATAARIMVTGPRTLKKQAEAYQRRSMADVTQDTY